MKNLYIFICALILFILIESIWLRLMSHSFYQAEIGHLLKPNPNFVAAVLFFLLYVLAICYFVIYPQSTETSLIRVFSMGALLGLAAYGTYDLTCLALFKGFSVKVAVVDTLWGGFLTGTVACGITCLARHFKWLS